MTKPASEATGDNKHCKHSLLHLQFSFFFFFLLIKYRKGINSSKAPSALPCGTWQDAEVKHIGLLQYKDQSRAGAKTRGTPRATVRRCHQGCQGGSRRDGQAKTEQQHYYFLIFFFPNEYGKATKPPQKHIFHFHS